MALTTTDDQKACHADVTKWTLYGHEATLLGACAYDDVFATCDISGAVLLWQKEFSEIRNVCRLTAKGPSVLDVVFTSPTRLAGAQGDGCVSLWDVESGVRECLFTLYAHRASPNWPVLNCLCNIAPGEIVYAGDDGHLVRCDERSRVATSLANMRLPLTALLSLDNSLFIGDVCGHVHWFDVRMMNRMISEIRGSSGAVTSLVASPTAERVIGMSTSRDVFMLDVQPFALTEDERLLGQIEVDCGDDGCLRRCAWSSSLDVVAFPSATGVVYSLRGGRFGLDQPQTTLMSSAHQPLNAVIFVQDKFLLTVGASDVVLREWSSGY